MHPHYVDPITVVVVTRDRREALLETLARLGRLPERPDLIVVDNGSRDGTAAAVRRAHPGVRLFAFEQNHGAAGRNVGVREAATELVAFCDDDSWFEPGALRRAAELFAARPRLGLAAARILVGDERRLDECCARMARTPLGGGRVLGFVAAGVVVRRAAFLDADGFRADYGVGGEERLLALDMAAAGWELVYAEDVVAHHHPAVRGAHAGRRRAVARNDLWSAWLRRPLRGAASQTLRAAWSARGGGEALAGFVDALRGAPRVLRGRRPVPAHVERAVRALEREG